MSFYINGVEPDIVGKQCKGFYLIQQQEGETITDPANFAYLKFDEEWLKFCFDGGTIFWRSGESPSEPVNTSLTNSLVLVNLNEFNGVVSHVLKAVGYESNNESVSAIFEFVDGVTIKFQHHSYDDYTSVNC